MKKIYLFLVLLSGFIQAQVINIPDANFKARLLAANPTNWTASNTVNPFSNIHCVIDTNGNGEIEVAEAALITTLDVNNANISNLQGIEYFVNLKTLAFYTNQVSYFDASPFPNLINLQCSYNQISNPLDLTVCPNLSGASIYHNLIPSLNVSGLTHLVNLNCEVNLFTSLDLSGLSSLRYIWCEYNPLTSLNVTNLPALESFNCYNCQLTEIDLTGTNNILTMNCNWNQIHTLDVSHQTQIHELSCAGNQLTVLPASGLTTLTFLSYSQNMVPSLDVSNLVNLTGLGCDKNPITTLDVSPLTNLTGLSCGSNELTTLYMKNGKDETLSLTNSPNLTFVCADDTQLANVQSQVNAHATAATAVSSYCSFVPGGDYNTITGKARYDFNANGCDNNDIFSDFIRINLGNVNGNGASFANATGDYYFYVGTGTYTLTPQFENPAYFSVTPTSSNAIFPLLDNSTQIRDFCVTANGTHPDLEVVIVAAAPMAIQQGFFTNYKIIYRNKGNQVATGSVNLAFDDSRIDFQNSNPNPDSQNLNSIFWNFTNLQPFQSGEINVHCYIHAPTETAPVNIGDTLTYTVSIDAGVTDDIPSDNTFVLDQAVINSVDPNIKTCLEGSLITPEKIGQYLHYNIDFENIGTTEATNIVVKDTIDTSKFDINTLQVMYASNPVRVKITGNVVEFIFENINLPSSITNPIGGHGNVLFKIKTLPTLTAGTVVTNTANIFFDYNHPIETNEARTTFALLKRDVFETDDSISVYPNPTKNKITVSAKNNLKSIAIFNIQGRLLQTMTASKMNATIDISNKQNGVYFIKITTEKGTAVQKIIKE